MGREHLAVGVDVDALALGLLEQLLQVLQVVAGDQDGLALLAARADLGRHRMAVACRCWPASSSSMTLRLISPHFRTRPTQVVDGEVRVGGGGERLVEEGVDLVVLLAEDPGVVGVGADPLEAEEQDVLQGQGVGVGGRVGLEAVRVALGHQFIHAAWAGRWRGRRGNRPGRPRPLLWP